MTRHLYSRRSLLRSAAAAGVSLPFVAFARNSRPAGLANDRPHVAAIGVGWKPEWKRTGRGFDIAAQAAKLGDLVAVCDVDRQALDYARANLADGRAEPYHDYRDVLSRPDVDAVLIGTPDHWHVKMAVEAIRAGKDVYCEKPVTLTVDEGRLLREVLKSSDRVFQVGTQQRSEFGGRFLSAVALVRSGRLGKVRRVLVGIERGEDQGPFAATEPPARLDWDRWLGPAPETPYIEQRTHRLFRWWHDYAGGKLTDWGAHHVDIAQWAIGMERAGPTEVEGTATFPQPLRYGLPTRSDTFDNPVTFRISCRFPNGVETVIHHEDNGILFEGEEGTLFVNRGKLTADPPGLLAWKGLPDAVLELCGGREPGSHMGHFFDRLRDRGTPISDFETHHRAVTTCHLAHIAVRLGRKLTWDAEKEQIVDDREASGWLAREPRAGYEIKT